MPLVKPVIGSTGWGAVLNAALDYLAANSGGSTLIVVNGGTVDLDNSKPNGTLIGYRVTATTVFDGVSIEPGSYMFTRETDTAKAPLGWMVKPLDEGTALSLGPVLTTENFNRADGTTLNGKTSTTGGATLISPARSTNAGNNATNATTVGNKVTVPAGTTNEGRNIAVLTDQQDYEVSIDYAFATSSSAYQARVVARAAVPDDDTNAGNSVILVAKGDGSLGWESSGVSGTQTLASSGIPTSGRLTLRVQGPTFSAFINGVQVGASWTQAKTGAYAVAGVYNVGTSMDNFEVAYL